MIKKFEKYIQQQKLFSKNDRILLAVSGGKDSVAMTHLFHKAKLNFGIAHCNFKLRGKQSDLDEQFVKRLAKSFNIPFFSTQFDTKKHAQKNKISVQMAARELRYQWFEEIRKKNKCTYIATAHHQNDVAETMLINLSKGTGLAGLHGISNKNGLIIRPLLCFTQQEITDFADQNNIKFREDASNKETKYVRNKIRHKVIPELQKINPSAISTLYNESIRFKEIEQLLETKINDEKKKCLKVTKNNQVEIDILKLSQLNSVKVYLYYFLKPYGFNTDDVDSIFQSFDKSSGKQFYSASHHLIKDRNTLIIIPNQSKIETEHVIKSVKDLSKIPFLTDVKKYNKPQKFSVIKEKEIAQLDFDKLIFPLSIRRWRKGDRFKPFGMKGAKKLSDFFIDEKFSLNEKENVWLLTSNQQIAWVVGFRIGDDYKVTTSTTTILQLEKQ